MKKWILSLWFFIFCWQAKGDHLSKDYETASQAVDELVQSSDEKQLIDVVKYSSFRKLRLLALDSISIHRKRNLTDILEVIEIYNAPLGWGDTETILIHEELVKTAIQKIVKETDFVAPEDYSKEAINEFVDSIRSETSKETADKVSSSQKKQGTKSVLTDSSKPTDRKESLSWIYLMLGSVILGGLIFLFLRNRKGTTSQ